MSFRPTKTKIIQSKLGTIIYPYHKGTCSELEKKTCLYSYPSPHNKRYVVRTEFTGFQLPYNNTQCFLTHYMLPSYLSGLVPNSEFHKLPLNLDRKMGTPIYITSGKEMREGQSQIVRRIEATKGKENAWFVNMQTGEGKTFLSIYLAAKFNLKTWILCYSDDILQQWEEAILNDTSIEASRVLRVTGPTIDKLMCGKKSAENYDIFLSTPALLYSYGKRTKDFYHLGELFDTCGIGTLIYDEAHRSVGSLVRINAVTNVKYQLYLSADFAQGDDRRDTLFKKVFANVPILSPSKSIQKTTRYTKLVVMKYNTYPYEDELDAPFDNRGYDPEKYMNYQFSKVVINKVIRYILDMILSTETNHRVLLLFVNIAHVNAMYEYLNSAYGHQFTIGRYHGEVSQEEKKRAKDDTTITIATYSSFGTGLDTENIKYIISANQCNKVMDNQAAGRARALADGSKAMYFMLVDEGFTYCRKKLRSRLAYLMETKSSEDAVYHFEYKGE